MLDTATLISNNELTKDKLIEVYLDYVNNFLTVSAFAQWHGLTERQANVVIKRGRELNNEKCCFKVS